MDDFQNSCKLRPLHISSHEAAAVVLKEVGVDPYGIEAMLPKMNNINVYVEEIECKIANILKQEMLSVGGDCAVARESVGCTIPSTDAVLMGSIKQINRFCEKIAKQPFQLEAISKRLKQILKNMEKAKYVLVTAKRQLILGESTTIMGILNVTPDSFSDGGLHCRLEDAVKAGISMADEGADIIDVGGESSRPGARPVESSEELNRIVPVIRELSRKIKCPISVDTTKADVAKAAMENGAEIVNDISAMRSDPAMLQTIKETQAAVVLMHMKGTPETMQTGDLHYRSLRADIMGFLQARIEAALSAGINEGSILIDPGLGFGKTPEHNLELISHLSEFKALGFPLIIGPSRKSFIGHVTGGAPSQRIEGTAAVVSVAIMNGAKVLRVHDVEFMKKTALMVDAVRNCR